MREIKSEKHERGGGREWKGIIEAGDSQQRRWREREWPQRDTHARTHAREHARTYEHKHTTHKLAFTRD